MTDLTRGDLVAVRYICHKISASRTLPTTVLQDVLGKQDLPEGLQTLLRQQVFDPSVLREFGAIDQRVQRLMFSKGVNTPLGTIINPAEVGAVASALEKAKADYEDAVPRLIAAFEAACDETERKLEERFSGEPYYDRLMTAVRKVRPEAATIEETVHMEFYLFHVGQINEGFDFKADEAVQTGVTQLRSDLPGRLFREVAQFFSGRLAEMNSDVIRPRSVEATLRVLEKVESMAFLDPAISKMADAMSSAFSAFGDGSRSLIGGERAAFLSVVRRLSSQRHLVRCFELGIDPTEGPEKAEVQPQVGVSVPEAVGNTVPLFGTPVVATPVAASAPSPTPIPVQEGDPTPFAPRAGMFG